jgi:hypothetical protein
VKRDNSTFAGKVALRKAALSRLGGPPVVLESHGGSGRIFGAIYRDVARGVVFEKDPRKAEVLAVQRPTWSVYEGDCVGPLALGAGSHLEVNLLDVDPYGDPWPTLDAFLGGRRPRAPRLMLAVNDGLLHKIEIGGAWQCSSLGRAVARHGNNLGARYLDVCRELIEEKAAPAGYRLAAFAGRRTGSHGRMAHYLAELVR